MPNMPTLIHHIAKFVNTKRNHLFTWEYSYWAELTSWKKPYLLVKLNDQYLLVKTSELYKDWNDTSIRPAVWLGEAKLMAAGGSHALYGKNTRFLVLYR